MASLVWPVYQIHPPGRATSRALNQMELEKFVRWLVLAASVVLVSLLAPSTSQETNTTLPLTYHARAAEGGEKACSPDGLNTRPNLGGRR